MSDLREKTGITRTPEAEVIISLRADLVAARAEIERLRESNKELAAALRGIRDMADDDIRTGVSPPTSMMYQIEADARAALAKATDGRDGAAQPTKGTTDDSV